MKTQNLNVEDFFSRENDLADIFPKRIGAVDWMALSSVREELGYETGWSYSEFFEEVLDELEERKVLSGLEEGNYMVFGEGMDLSPRRLSDKGRLYFTGVKEAQRYTRDFFKDVPYPRYVARIEKIEVDWIKNRFDFLSP